MPGNEFPLSLIIRAVDKATGPLRQITSKLRAATAPFGKAQHGLADFARAAGVGRVIDGFKGVGSAIGNVGREAFALGAKIATMAGAAGFALFALVKHVTDVGDELAKNADRVGLTVDAYAQLSYVADRAGISQEEFTGAIDKFNKGLGEAKAHRGSLFAFLKEVSPQLLHQAVAAKSTEDALDLMFRAMVKLKDPTKRAAFAMDVFGRGGVRMSQMVRDGVEDIDRLKKEYARIAGPQEKFARGSEVLQDVMTDVVAAFDGVVRSIVTELGPSFVSIGESIRDFFAENREPIRQWAHEFGEKLPGYVRDFKDAMMSLWAKVAPVFDAIGGWKGLLIGVGVVLAGPLIAAAGGLVAAFVTLGIAMVATPFGWVVLAIAGVVAAAAALAAGLVYLYQTNDVFQTSIDSIVPSLKEAGVQLQALWDLVKPMLPDLKALGTVLMFGVKLSIDEVKGSLFVITSTVHGLIEAFNLLGKVGHFLTWASAPGGGPAGSPFGATPAAAGKSPTGQADSMARVAVSFDNLPKGARVTADKDGWAPLDLQMGYAMTTP